MGLFDPCRDVAVPLLGLGQTATNCNYQLLFCIYLLSLPYLPYTKQFWFSNFSIKYFKTQSLLSFVFIKYSQIINIICFNDDKVKLGLNMLYLFTSKGHMTCRRGLSWGSKPGPQHNISWSQQEHVLIYMPKNSLPTLISHPSVYWLFGNY